MGIPEKRIGYIGLGAMGGAMAGQLLKAGVKELTVYDVNASTAAALEKQGARGATTPAEVGEKSDILILSLPHPKVLDEVLFGENGATGTLAEGSVVIDMSTNGLKAVREAGEKLSQQGVAMIDAPVGKGPYAAEKGELTIMTGGEKSLVDSLRWLFDILGSDVYYFGPLGAGQAAKLANNLASCANMAVVAEAYALAEKGGVDIEALMEVMPKTSADSWQLRRTLIDKILKGDFSPMFKLGLARKDMQLIVEMAEDLDVPISCGKATLEWYNRGAEKGYSELDWGAILLTEYPDLKQ